MTYFVDYNGQYIASFKSMKRCLNFINRKNLKNDYRNSLYIVDQEGECYNTVTGEKLEYIY